MAGHYCIRKKDIPQKEHFVILQFEQTLIPGDERSKTCPGHGYPERYHHNVVYITFDNEKEWLEEIREKTINKADFLAHKVSPVKISQEVVVTVTSNEGK